MAKKRNQYKLGIIRAEEMQFVRVKGEKNDRLVFDTKHFDVKFMRSKEVMTSENRLFRTFSHDTETKSIVAKDENTNQPIVDENGELLQVEVTVNLAREFVVVDMSKCKELSIIVHLLKKGFTILRYDADGNQYEEAMRIALRSPSQVRQGKAIYTTLNVAEIRRDVTFNMEIATDEVIAKIRAHEGLGLSSTIEITDEKYTFDVMPDYEIERTHDVEIYDQKSMSIQSLPGMTKSYNPLDGQGTILPSAAIRTAQKLHLISRKDRKFMLQTLEQYRIVKLAYEASEEFAELWKKIPSAFQVRMGLNKGLLIVHEHQYETTDCNGSDHRSSADKKIMRFWKGMGKDFYTVVDGEEIHYYNFQSDIMFTDSMWKRNFDPKRIDEVNLEIVLYQKPRKTNRTFMGYQYWQALKGVNVKNFAAREIKKLHDSIFTDAGEALAFLNMIDSGDESKDDYEDRMQRAGTKVQKIIEVLHENPDMIEERWVQKSIRQLKEQFIDRMKGGRIPVDGCNPYIATAVECMFGRKSVLQAGQHYFNNTIGRYAGFRSPLIHESEAVVINTVEVPSYEYFYNDLLIMNPYDDTLPRMGGADTDGDRIAMVDNEEIVNAVQTDLPMLYDEGFSAKARPVNRQELYEYDLNTITNDAPTIGQITNMASTWKDLLQNEDKMKQLGFSVEQIETIVKILRFMQGWAIDFAKTGWFPKVPKYVNTNKSPDWLPWSMGAVNAGIKGAEVFESKSQLGMLSRAVKSYLKSYKEMETKEDKKRSYRDFFFEITDHADKVEENRIRPIVKALFTSYNKELQSLRDMKLEEDELKEFMSHIFDKYQRAILSIDADISSIASAAYKVAYSKGKNKAVSFPWVVAYEGMLINIAATTETRLKLRKADYEGHIDDIPSELSFYRRESKTAEYIVTANVKNGTYKTYRKNGQLYIAMAHAGLKKSKKDRTVRPDDLHIPFTILGFKQNGQSAESIIDILKENDGIVTAKRVRDNGPDGELRIGIFAEVDGELTRICSTDKDAKDIIGSYLPCTFQVGNIDDLKPTFTAKKDESIKETKAYHLDATYIDAVETDIEEENLQTDVPHYDDYMYNMDGGSYGYFYADPNTDNYVEIDTDDLIDEMPSDRIESIMEELSIVHASAEYADDLKVILTNENGKSLTIPMMILHGDIVVDYSSMTPTRATRIKGSEYENLAILVLEKDLPSKLYEKLA
ncbi:RNA dependent RNA polymerase (plasmid) [Paenibacillus sp. EC2-1]|uniref:RNA dependent RNA polymerase n=1 Tax=Paenibacillus sp. EC2-1 TaxID=3388665 RepID=UPI003BEEC4AD